MKICPRCQKTYADDNLNFCLEDGSVLSQASAAPPQPPPSYGGQPQQAPAQPQWNVGGQPQYSMQPAKKSSKAWIWVLLILGVVVLLCGGGIGGLIYLGKQVEKNANLALNNGSSNTSFSNKNGSNSSTTNSTSSRTDVEKLDISRWVKQFSVFGTTEFTDGELIVGSKQKGYYYVLAAPDEPENRTDDADVAVTVRNIDEGDTKLGYGLVFHSNPTPLQQGYAFLIDAKRKRFRVVHHTPGEEKVDVPWTTSTAIKTGKDENRLEVRDQSDKIELYINGTMVKSIENKYGYANGVPGLYSGDGIKVAFKDMEVRK